MKARCGFVFVAMFALLLVGCGGRETVKKEPEIRQAVLSAGTPVPLILLTELAAGTSEVGSKVTFVVTSDVKVAGGVAIPRGTIAEGSVSQSRSEGMLSAAMNRPVRLAVKLGRLELSNGTEVLLTVTPKDETEGEYQFTGANTAGAKLEGEVKRMVDGAQKATIQDLNVALEQFLATGDTGQLKGGEATEKALKQLLSATDMKRAERYLDDKLGKKSLDDLASMLARAREGSLTNLGASDVVLALGALQELGKLAGAVEKGLSSVFRGHTLRAHVGTGVTAYVARNAQVTVRIP